MDVDKLYRQLGKPGWFHVVVYILICLSIFPVVINHFSSTIYGARIGFRCHDAPEESLDNGTRGHQDGSWDVAPGSCQALSNSSNATSSCPAGRTYITQGAEANIVTDFDLSCERSYLVNLATTIYFFGVMIGGLIFGSLSDRFGRKPFLLLTLYIHIVIGAGLFFAPNYIIFVLLRFLLGILMQGLQVSIFVISMELFSVEYRAIVGTFVEVFWAVGILLFAFVSYLIEDWRYIQLAISLPFVLTISYIWIIPESPRWLIAHHKYNKAEIILKRAAKFNGVELDEDLFAGKLALKNSGTNQEENSLNSVTDNEDVPKENVKQYNVLDMFKTPKLRKRSIILFYIWFVMAFGYYGLTLSVTSLAGNKYLNLFIAGAIELPAYCAAIPIVNTFGRRKPLCVYLAIGGVFCIMAGVIPSSRIFAANSLTWPTVLALIGRFGMAGSFSMIFLFTAELYPTVIRNVSVGACTFWTRVGGLLAPQVLELGEVTFAWFPIILFGCMALVGSGLTFLLPETLNKNLPDTLDQAEQITKKRTKENYQVTQQARNSDIELNVKENSQQLIS